MGERRATTDDRAGGELPKAYVPADVEGADLPALARRGRLRPGRRRLAGERGPGAVHDHPAAAEHHRLAAPGPRPADRGRGPAHPARPDAGPPGAVPAGRGPRLDRRAVRPRQDHCRRGRDAGIPRARALPRADVAVHQRDARGDARAAATAGRLHGLVAPPVHDGRRLGEGGAGRVRAAVSRRAGLPDRGAHQLVPGLPHQRVRPRDDPDAGDRHALDDPLPPHRRGDRPAERDRDDQRRHDAARDDPGRHGGRGASRRTSATRRSSAGGCASRSWIATCRSSPTRRWTARSARARSRSRRPTTRTTTSWPSATTCR